MVLVAGLILAINFAPVPDAGALVLGLAHPRDGGWLAFVIRQRRAQNPLYDLQVAGAAPSGSPPSRVSSSAR